MSEINSLDSLAAAIACDSRDWSIGKTNAFLYGIVCGWDEASKEVSEKYGFDEKRMNQLHEDYKKRKR